MKPKFYTFNQNNSGGYYVNDKDAGVCEYVIIEANNPEEACEIFQNIGDSVVSFWNSCPCCGVRWCNYMDESDGKDTPMIFGKDVNYLKKEMFQEECYIHYLNGIIKHIIFK